MHSRVVIALLVVQVDSNLLLSYRGTACDVHTAALHYTQDMYGDGVLNHLSAMAAESDELSAGLNRTLFTPIWDR